MQKSVFLPPSLILILECIFRSFVLLFIFTCWRCLDKLLRINFPSASCLPFLNWQVRSHHMHLKGLSGWATRLHCPSHACPYPSREPVKKPIRQHVQTLLLSRPPLPSHHQSLYSPCQNQYNWIRPNTQEFSLKVRSVPFSLIYSLA